MWIGYEVMVRYHSAVHGVQWSLDKVTTLIRYMCLYYRVSVTFDAAPTCLSQMCVLHMSHCMLTCLHKCTAHLAQNGPCANLTKVPHSHFPVLVFTMFLLSAQTKHARQR